MLGLQAREASSSCMASFNTLCTLNVEGLVLLQLTWTMEGLRFQRPVSMHSLRFPSC